MKSICDMGHCELLKMNGQTITHEQLVELENHKLVKWWKNIGHPGYPLNNTDMLGYRFLVEFDLEKEPTELSVFVKTLK